MPAPDTPDTPDTGELPELYREVGEELMRIGTRRQAHQRGTVLDRSAFRLLQELRERPELTLRDLAEATGLDQSTINRQVAAAVRAGWLERFAVPGSTVRPVRSTPAGAAAYEADLAIVVRTFSEALEELGPERVTGLLAHLRDYNDAFERAHDRR